MTAAPGQTIDDELCLQIADGHKWTFIIASLTKRALQIPGIKPADRLDLLERLNSLTDGFFTADVLAQLSPMCDTAYAIFKEARSLDPSKDDARCEASFKVLATPSVFRLFVQLNPSILAAIKQHAATRRTAPMPPPAETPPPRPAGAMSAAAFAEMQRRGSGNGMTRHLSYSPLNQQINRMGGGLPDFAYDNEATNQ